MNKHKALTFLITSVWIINGLFCKVLNLVPRHEEIVSRILGNTHSGLITKLIGLAEIAMAIWILTGYKKRPNTIAQIILVMSMNILEFIMTQELLLWGRLNLLFASLFVFIVYYNQFILKKNQQQQYASYS